MANPGEGPLLSERIHKAMAHRIGSEVFPVSFWIAPPTELLHYQKMAEGGFTVAQIWAPTPDEGRQALELARQVGIWAIVWDPRLHRELPKQAGWENVVRQVVHDYADQPALYGYHLADEPHPRDFAPLASLARACLALDPERVPYINILPNYVGPAWLGTNDYRQHVRQYLETVQPPFFSYDHYALLEEGDRPGYFANLEVVRQETLRAGIPFWNVILATPHRAYRDPTPAELRWQVYTTLVYGGKGISYWTYYTSDTEGSRNGICGPYGQYGAKYEAVQQLNLELQRLAKHLLALTSVGVYHYPDTPEGTTLLRGEGIVESISGGSFIIGEFVDPEGLPWFMVTNRDREHAAHVILRLRTRHTSLGEVGRNTGALRPLPCDPMGDESYEPIPEGLRAHFWLAPGDGRLFRLG